MMFFLVSNILKAILLLLLLYAFQIKISNKIL